jgi:hypothetical protein
MPHRNDHKVLIIAGMHRSGTSLISQWLSKCGLNIGEQLEGPQPSNVEGHFEDVDFKRFHEDILISNGLPDTGLTEETVAELTGYQKEKLRHLIGFKNRLHTEWGWKEPRTCLFLSVYQQVIPRAFYLVIIRDYECVISSLIQREFKVIEKKYLSRVWFSRTHWKIFRKRKQQVKLIQKRATHYLRVWINYNEELLKLIAHIPERKYLVINYELLNEDDRIVFAQLTNQWGFSLNYVAFKSIFKKNLISENLQIVRYINDGALLERANQLQETLRNYLSGDRFEDTRVHQKDQATLSFYEESSSQK